MSVTTQMVALAAITGWSPSPGADVKATMAAALIHSLQCGGASASCPKSTDQTKLAGDNTKQRVEVPAGATQCPDSPAGVSCGNRAVTSDPGNSATPDGQPACPADPTKPVTAPGSCVPPPAGSAPAASSATPPTASPTAGGPAHSPGAHPAGLQTLTLGTSSYALNSGGVIFLDAKSTLNVTGTPYAIEIFDTTTKALVAACTQASECVVSFSAKSGDHSFVAYVVPPTQSLPSSGAVLTSNKVNVRFLGVSLQVNNPAIVAPGKAVTFVATATQDVTKTGFVIELHDAFTGERLDYCRHGVTCSMSLVEPAGGVHSIIATLGPSSPEALAANPDVHATSNTVSATWLALQLTASVHSGIVSISAIANADLSQTPYSIYFFDQAGKQVGDPCNAQTCSAVTPAPAGGAMPAFIAVIARMPVPATTRAPLTSVQQQAPIPLSRLDIQAATPAQKPSHLLWGVDSCQELTDDPNGSTGLLPQVRAMLGAPDFWARYLPNTPNCGGLNQSEINVAHAQHFGILPIYNDYDCSAVSGNAAGSAYGIAATNLAQHDQIALGTAIAIDIEPPGPGCPGAANVDTAFIQGWYDSVSRAGYAPAYYGNTSAGSEFATAWCTTVQQRPEIAANSYLWSFEPSLLGPYSQGRAPGYDPYNAGCAGHYFAWQYMISAGSTPNVDQDEASSDLPIWYP